MTLYMIIGICVLFVVTILYRIVNLIKRLDKINEDISAVTSEDSITISGKISLLREKFPDKSDAQIISEAHEKFQAIFANGLTIIGENPDKLTEYFDCKVFLSLDNKDTLVSKVVAKNVIATNLLKVLGELINKNL